MEQEKEVVRIFVASSVKEFEVERGQISIYFETLNQAHEKDGVRIEWYRPETMSRTLVRGGSQLSYDEKIKECSFFVLLIGRQLGKYTEKEFNLALECFQNIGKPLIIPYFLNVSGDTNVDKFKERLRYGLDIGEQYINTYNNLDVVLNQLHIELIRAGAFRRKDAELSDREATADKGIDDIRELIHEQQECIRELDAQPVTPLVIRKKTAIYEEIRRLVQKYGVEPDALHGYMDFLWKQHLYDAGIELGNWLNHFYALYDPGEVAWAWLKNRIGIYYAGSNRHKEAERYYREALKIRRRLAKTNPAVTFESDLAKSYNNLANVLKRMNQMEEAERYYRESLKIKRRLAKTNPAVFGLYPVLSYCNLANLLDDTNRKKEAEKYYRKALKIQRHPTQDNFAEFEPNLAYSLNSFAHMLNDTNRKEEAEQYYREALEIRRRLAKANPAAFEPYLAYSLNSLALLLSSTNREEEAERYYREALKIRRRLAKANPAAFEPNLATTCYNLGMLEHDKGNSEAAKQYLEEALSLYEKFPYLENRAQQCRDALTLVNKNAPA